MGAHTHYSDQALDILRDAAEVNLAGDLAVERAGGVSMNPPARRTPDELRELARTPLTAARSAIAREALERHGFTATGTDEHGHTVYRRDYTRSSFAWLTLAYNGHPVAVNPRRVLHVESQDWGADTWYTTVVLTHGDPIRVRESVEEATEKLDAAAA